MLRKIEGATPSERKVFRAMERARLDLLEEGTKRKAPVGMSLSNNTSKESVASLAGDISFQQRWLLFMVKSLKLLLSILEWRGRLVEHCVGQL